MLRYWWPDALGIVQGSTGDCLRTLWWHLELDTIVSLSSGNL
ncbi:hypothetical protein [Niastella populi]|nr:hypothetical protein [Niastella populi]